MISGTGAAANPFGQQHVPSPGYSQQQPLRGYAQQTPVGQQTGMKQPGMQQPGFPQQGMQQPGIQQRGMQQPVMQQPGMTMQQLGMGMQQPGMGMQQQGMQQQRGMNMMQPQNPFGQQQQNPYGQQAMHQNPYGQQQQTMQSNQFAGLTQAMGMGPVGQPGSSNSHGGPMQQMPPAPPQNVPHQGLQQMGMGQMMGQQQQQSYNAHTTQQPAMNAFTQHQNQQAQNNGNPFF